MTARKTSPRKVSTFASLLCERCGEDFLPTSGAQVYCVTCIPVARKEYKAQWQKEQREARRPPLGELEHRHPVGPAEYQQAKRALHLNRIDELMALSPANDPFYCGTGYHKQLAGWYSGLWGQAAILRGHIRRIHYWYTGQDNPVRADGVTPYENTDTQWIELVSGARYARILGLLDPEDLDDKRNDQAIINCPPRTWDPEPWAGFPDDWQQSLTISHAHLPPLQLSFPYPCAYGYDYQHADRAALVECFIEKSTQNDILDPLCRWLGVNLTTGKGNTSITRIIELLRRAEQLGKPGHIITICDFDPGGESMPRSIGRQVQFWAQELGIEQEISVETVALTREQVEHYGLPPIPLKEKDRRGPSFRYRHGVDGGVELDALEARHPGELARLVRQAVEPWLDDSLEQRLGEADAEADDVIADQWESETAGLREQMQAIRDEAELILDRYRKVIADLNRELKPLRSRLGGLADEAQELLYEIEFDLPDRPEPDEPDVDRDVFLFDSHRTWLEQLPYWQRHRNGDA